ncbi:BtrH N-terminal domain-containing protein [Paenibacillus sp. FSL M7-0420]|uniref:BtrH N-terminal domain-containing protein n=1 Tax=Paenibacillus sp. FSL M7-0420 TaxID=2921609 RepID=UPI0030F997DB
MLEALLDIKPLWYENSDCFESIIASVADWKGYNYEMIFTQSWGFGIDEENPDYPGLLGWRIHSGKGRIAPVLREFHRIEFVMQRAVNFGELMNIILNELNKGLPIAIEVDIYNCPWQNDYQKIHNSHFVLVVGMDNATCSLICVDTMPPKNNVSLPVDFLQDKLVMCGIFNYLPAESSPLDARPVLREVTAKVLGHKGYYNNFGDEFGPKNNFETMRLFAMFVRENMNLRDEVYGYDQSNLNMAPIIWRLKNIGWNRKLFTKSLEYMSRITPQLDFSGSIEQLNHAALLWDWVSNLLWKSALSGNLSNNNVKIADKIMQAADLEEEIAYMFTEMC